MIACDKIACDAIACDAVACYKNASKEESDVLCSRLSQNDLEIFCTLNLFGFAFFSRSI